MLVAFQQNILLSDEILCVLSINELLKNNSHCQKILGWHSW